MIYFVTPAWRRYELTAICLAQRKGMVDALAAGGLEARCVVIADDDNLAVARSLGFDTVERDNRWLGRKFNDGIQYALDHGAEWVAPIGSDSWLDPAYLAALAPGQSRTSEYYALVESRTMLVASIPNVGPHVLHRSVFERSGPRPAEERLRRGFDRSLMAAIGTIDWDVRNVHRLQYIGFRGERHITLYEKVRKAWGGVEEHDPWTRLAQHYDAPLVERAHAALAAVKRPLSIGPVNRWAIEDKIRTWLARRTG